MLCTRCGNEVKDPARCPVCAAGRGTRKAASKEPSGPPACPRCSDPLERQEWDGIPVLSCPACRGSFFPERGLEEALNKLRATVSATDMATVLSEFKGRFTRSLPTAIRYKSCPVCRTVMTRRNYGSVSGVIVDHCGQHGTWVDESAFAELADFITRGGDLLAMQARRIQARAGPAAQQGAGSILERLFGGR